MKKTAALLLAALTALSLFGCGKTPAAPAEPPRTELGSEAAEQAEAYLEALRPQLRELEAALQGIAALDCAMEGGDLVILFRFNENVTVSKEALENMVNSSGDTTYRQMYDDFAAYMQNEDVRVAIRGLKADGETLFERVIDKTAAPDVDGTEPEKISLTEYVYSSTFQNTLSAQGSEVLSVWAEVEGNNVMVICYEYSDPLSDEQKTALRERLQNDADGSLAAGADELLAMVREAVTTENISLVYRWADPDGETIAEQRFE